MEVAVSLRKVNSFQKLILKTLLLSLSWLKLSKAPSNMYGELLLMLWNLFLILWPRMLVFRQLRQSLTFETSTQRETKILVSMLERFAYLGKFHPIIFLGNRNEHPRRECRSASIG